MKSKTTHFQRKQVRARRELFYWRCDRIPNRVFLRKILGILSATSLVIWGFSSFWQVPFSFSQSNSIMINEFMPDPAESDEATKPNGEWIELYNRAGSKDLAGWVLKDKYDNHILEIIPENTDTGGTVIAEGGYLVVYRNGDKDFSLNQDDDQIRLFDDGGNLVDSVLYSGSVGEGKSWSLRSTEWVRNTDPTPGAENSFPEEETKDQQEEEQPQPTISFSAPSSVVVGKMFSVQVMLTGFEPGSYRVKVLIAKGENLNYGEMNVSGKYGAWETMPLVKVGQTTTVQTKTDQDIEPGNYDIRIRVQYNCVGKSYCESGAKPLKVAGSEKPGGTSGALGGEELGSDNAEGILGEAAGEDGKVKGEEATGGDGFKLNFYTILGIFGMLVGGGGLILSFAKKRVPGPEGKRPPSEHSEERGS